MRRAKDVHWQEVGKEARNWRIARKECGTDQSPVERNAQSQLNDEACRTIKVAGHRWSVDRKSFFLSDEEGEHKVLNLLLDVAPSSSAMLVEGFHEDEELARTALNCHLSMGLLCHKMLDACLSEDCRKVPHEVLQ